MTMQRGITAILACVAACAAMALPAEETMLHHGDSIDDIRLTWGRENPEARLELNSDKRFVSEGKGSILARSVSPPDASRTSYVGFRLPVKSMRLGDRALAFEIWSTEPENTLAFHVRGLNSKGKIVAGWSSWSHPLGATQQTFVLPSGREGGNLQWEESRIQAADDEIAFLEFIAGCTAKGKPYNMYVDHIRLAPAPKPVPVNYEEHGIVAPVGMPTWGRSTIATVDADGRRVVFTKLWTGSKASYLFIDAETGKTRQVFPEGSGWGAYNVLMTPGNIIYDTMGKHVVEIDVATRKVRQVGEFESGMSLGGYARAKDGTVYVGIYPSATLVSYNPKKDRYVNHGALNDESWPQYLRPLVIGKDGWVYGSIGLKEGQVVGFDPDTGKKVAFIPREKRQRNNPSLFRGVDGHAYASADGWGLHRLSQGQATPVDKAPAKEPGEDRDLFPDGSRITRINVPDRQIFIQDAGADKAREVRFDYKSTGVNIYTIIAGPDGKIHGATGIPLRVWNFDPASGQMWNSGLGGYGGHINQFARQGDVFYGAVYSSGALLEYDPRKPFDDQSMATSENPKRVHYAKEARDLYGRPHAVLAHPDGRHVLVGGNAARVLLGSGLLIYDIETGEGTILDRSQLIPDHGINAMVALPDGDVLVGTDIRPPTAGSAGPAKTAMVYRFDMRKRVITGQWPLKPDTPGVRDMVVASDGKVHGLAEPNRLFVFDPEKNEFTHDAPLEGYGNASGYQAPRCMINGPEGAIYALFRNAVVRIEPETLEHAAIARPNATVTSGIAIHNGRLYFGSGPRLFSCALEPPK